MVRTATLAVALAALLCATVASARVVTTTKARYETQEGKSRWHETEVTFMTGSELNEATRSYRYSPYAPYAVIFFGPGQAAVIKLSGYYGCGDKFTTSCLPSIGNAKGEDQDGTAWEICTGSLC